MFGFLKKFGKKNEPVAPLIPVPVAPEPVMTAAVAEAEYAPPPAPMPRPPTSARTMQPATPVPSVPRTAPAVRPKPVAEPRHIQPAQTFSASARANHDLVAPVPPATPVEPAEPVAEVVELPLKKLWHKLNPAITQAAASNPNGDSMLQVPLPFLHAQLAKGAVKIPFPEFRRFAPGGMFSASAEKDQFEVEIPISDLLPLLNPDHLSRRPNQRRVEVPDDIEPIFGPDGGPAHGVRIAEARPRTSPATAAATPPVAAVPSAPVAAPEARIAAPVVPKEMETPAPISPITPISPIAPAQITPIAPMEQAALAVPSYDLPPLQNEPIRAPKLDPSLATLKPKPAATNGTPKPAPAAAPAKEAAPAPQSEVFTIALMDVAAFWSEKGRNELANLYRHSLEIPMSTLEKALKGGKLNFQWREVRPWLRLAPGNTMPTLQDDLQIELPIAVIAPRFIEHRVNGRPKRKVEVGDDIPDVFEQKTPPPSPAKPSGAPALGATAVSMDLAAGLGASSKTGDTAFLKATGGKTLLEYGEIFGQPEKKNWTMAEITQKTMGLRGVAGAIIGSADGLLVAGSWPNGVKGDAVAAFLPQLYGRILQYTKELKLGEPGNLTLMIENVPLQIFKAGTSYFTVIGRAGENLPKAQLNAIATRLSTNFSVK